MLDTCITCISFHDPFRRLESDDSRVSRDAHASRCRGGRGNVHQLHNGQPGECNKFVKPVSEEGLMICST